ncbi:MAG TPA: ABC transporter permease subunit [Acidimicrobiales bacterium]|nr:ABC transporter permease subunit [Acidimicrobiales bacterium]
MTRGAAGPAPRGRRGRDPTGRRGVAAVVFNLRVLRVVGQLAAIALLIVVAAYLSDNYQANARDRNLRTGWGFLDEPTGFNIAFSDFRSGQPVRDALWVGVKNTAVSAVVGIVLATVLGMLVGVLRLSGSWVARKAATLYVEVLRNVPVLLIILFTAAGLQTLPRIDEAQTLGSFAAISNRGISVVSPVAGDTLTLYAVLLGVALAGALAVAAWRTRISDATGAPHHRVLWGGGLILVVAVVGYFALGGPVTLSRPEAGGRSIAGGASLNIPYVALTGALALYHGSHIAEIVRGSIQAVPHGQAEAATAIGLSDFQRLRFVILPQAFRIAVPPTINQYLSLTKNTSLGIAVAYSDVAGLAFRLTGARAPALQMFAIVMAIYLMFSLTTSLLLNVFNRRIQLVER